LNSTLSSDNEFYEPALPPDVGARCVPPDIPTPPVLLNSDASQFTRRCLCMCMKPCTLTSSFVRRSPRQSLRHPAVWAGMLVCAVAAQAQAPATPDWPVLQPVPSLRPAPATEAARQQAPMFLRAQTLSGQANVKFQAEGRVELRHAGVVLRSDELRYDVAEDLAVAQGNVRISFNGSVFTGPEVQMRVQRVQGFVLQPEYDLALTGGGGRAERIDFHDASRATVLNATYTSCPRDGPRKPDWIISAERLTLDVDAGVGVAEGGVLRFFDVPILSAPSFSFPLSDQRKSGWLPPSLEITTGSGIELGVPYYWNIAPQRDATIAPRYSTRRGFAVNGEFRYLDPDYRGQLNLDLLPHDQVAEHSRYWATIAHEGRITSSALYSLVAERVSDDEWWNDFPRAHLALTPRLLPLVAQVEQSYGIPALNAQLYARTQRWQVLQYPNTMEAPFDRAAQVGLRSAGNLGAGVEYSVETEFNRFELPDNPGYPVLATPSDGSRVHALGWISRPWREPGWWATPSLLLNAAGYRTDEPMSDGSRNASRTIPTFSLGGGAEFEKNTQWFGRDLRQTLEPRLLYVYTPYVNQSALPNFDSAVKDYSFASIFSENVFSGVDRVSDTDAITAGVTTRLLDGTSGAELLQLGVVQRYLFQDQVVTESGIPEKKGFSDVLLRGSTSVLQPWNLEAYLRYSPSVDRVVRTIVGAQYAPGPFRTLNLTYRYARDINSQVEVGWQWPIYESAGARRGQPASDGSCTGSWYSVGRLNYSTSDSRLTDSVVGVEYDAGCWIARMAVSRWSTGVSEASTQLLFQVELVGLSRLGSNAISVLKDNIPGYRLLRDGRSASPGSALYD
jgi:LPS-assembly protein